MKKTKSMNLALVAASLCLFALNSHADLIEITGSGANDGLWEITFVEDTYDNIAADLLDQVWWGDSALAGMFASALGPIAGVNNLGLNFSPLFVWGADIVNSVGSLRYAVYSNGGAFGTGMLPTVFTSGSIGNLSLVYATAQRAVVPEPGTLALLGLGLTGIGLMRRRRKF